MNGTVQFKLDMSVTVHKEGEWLVAISPGFDVASQGKTESEALRNLVEAVQAFVVTCFEMGTLNQVLLDAGFHPVVAKPNKKATTSERMVEVPLPLLVAQHMQTRQHVQNRSH